MRLLIFFFLVFICKQANGTTYLCDTTASCGCSLSSTVLTRIIGGEIAEQGSWSWTVSLRDNGSHFCGGSILSPLFIVTAAHCIVFKSDLSSISILAGSVNLVPSSSDQFYQIRSVAQIFQHPKYDAFTQVNDIALLLLSSPLDMTSGNIKPICLPTRGVAQPPDNISMIAVGWGVTTDGSNTASPILRQVTVESISYTSSDCQSIVSDNRSQFCAGLSTGGKDTCQGDSGGPLMAFVNNLWQLQGLTSYGYGCALAGYPGVYTRVSNFVSWIKSIIDPSGIETTTRTKKPTKTTATKTTVTKTTATKKSTRTARTTNRNLQGTTTSENASSQKSLLNLLSEKVSDKTDYSTEENLLAESLDQTSNNAKHATVQSFFVFFLPIIIGLFLL